VYIGVSAFAVNAVVAVVLTLILRAFKVNDSADDVTKRSDYGADENDPKVIEIEAAAAKEEANPLAP
jgi:SSS family solute:Na+ symporter